MMKSGLSRSANHFLSLYHSTQKSTPLRCFFAFHRGEWMQESRLRSESDFLNRILLTRLLFYDILLSGILKHQGERKMKDLNYYFDEEQGVLLAHEKSLDFTACYALTKPVWEYSDLTFRQYLHDFAFRRIEATEALKIANGALPGALLEDYIKIIEQNRKGED